MNLLDSIKEMNSLSNPSSETIRSILKEDYHIIVGDKNNYGFDLLKYDFFIEDGILFVGKLTDTNIESDMTTISIEMAAIYNDQLIDVLWDSYLSGMDVFIVDTPGHMHEAKINTGQYSLSSIKSNLKPGEIQYFNDIYSNPQSSIHPSTHIYIEDNLEAPICGYDAVKTAIEAVTNTNITTEKKAADFVILILPNIAKAPHHKIFEWLDIETAKIPIVTDTIKKKRLTVTEPHKILLYWSSNVIMSGFVNPNQTNYIAASQLDDAIQSYHKK